MKNWCVFIKLEQWAKPPERTVKKATTSEKESFIGSILQGVNFELKLIFSKFCYQITIGINLF